MGILVGRGLLGWSALLCYLTRKGYPKEQKVDVNLGRQCLYLEKKCNLLCCSLCAKHLFLFQFFKMEAIKELSKCNPKGRYWIKGDGTDVKAALQESMRNVWNGDVDLLDGKLQNLRTEYNTRISTSKTITTSNDIGRDDLVAALATMADALDEDVKFLDGGLREAVQTFRVKFNNPSTSTETLKGLNWDIVEFKTLLEQASVFKQKINDIIANLNPVAQQVPIEPNWRLWVKESPGYLQYLRNLFKKKRTCATHVLVFMVADEQRNTKPYAIQIQYVPYKGIRDQEVRDLTKGIKEQMTNAHLKVVGMFYFS